MNKKTLIAGVGVTTIALLLMPGSSAAIGGLLWATGGTESSWTYDDATDGWNNGEGYNSRECSYIENIVPVPGAAAANTNLEFTHSHTIETYWDGGAVAISRDGGATFTPLPGGNWFGYYSGLGTCFTDEAGGLPLSSYSGFATTPTTVSIDLGSIAPTDQLVVRFVLATDGSVTYGGWQVNTVSIGGVPLML